MTRERAKLERDVHELNTLEAANYLRRLARATGNPIIIWQIYGLYRRAGLPIPEDVLRAFDIFADRLQTASGSNEIAKALGLTGEKGGAQGAAALTRAKRHLHLAADVFALMEHDKSLPAARRWGSERIFAQVAQERELPVGAVKAAWRRHLKRVETTQARDAGALDTIAAALRPRKVR